MTTREPEYSSFPSHTCYDFQSQLSYTECIDETRYYKSQFGCASGTGGP